MTATAKFEPFEYHSGKLISGAIIVIEINGKLIPVSRQNNSPQRFIVLNDEKENNAINLQPIKPKKSQKPLIYKANWKD